jgi:DNA repair protein RecN (Recombination protein N)
VLQELHVASLGVIDDARLDLAPGLNVLSGETGAGKTLVTVALSLAIGARGSGSLVRSGSKGLAVEGLFSLTDGEGGERVEATELAEWAEDGEIVLARTVGADGRSAARITGRLAPLSALAGVGDRLVEIHGQNQAERVLQPAAQTAFLDRFAGQAHLQLAHRYREAHARFRQVQKALERLVLDARERERQKDLLRYQVREIEAAGVAAGELDALAEEEARLAHAERILTLSAGAEDALGGEGAALDRLRAAAAGGEGMGSLDGAAASLAGDLASLVADAEDALARLRSYRESVAVDPARLEVVRERIQALRGLERKYGDGEDGILAYLAEAGRHLATLEGEDSERASLEGLAEQLHAEATSLAGDLTAGRAGAAPRLATALTEELQELGMPGATVDVALQPLGDLRPDGTEQAELTLSAGAGQPSRPLARAASGGEMSRTILACRSVLADLDGVPTLVFDEVDSGIGGRTAVAVGRRLAGLAARRQVLVVTHLAQIAAHADRHFVVTKDHGTTSVRPVEGDERIAELARMLSGSTGRASLAHARELVMGTAP